ncbi:MAG: FprA family A-type flavoprotein [Bacteroidales bacterium]|jgi:flavorubredoxin|nr:FprA family A-type flavoprotein [Bacteroidales bacterium]
MKDINKILKLNERVSWIGIYDYDITTFDVVMETKYGTTYNSYFINAQKKVIVETAKAKFSDIYLEKVKKVCNPAEVSYIILNHTEPDHSGSLSKLLEICPNAIILGSGQAIRYLQDLHETKFKYQIVKEGDELDLGDATIKFISAPNLHWPDSIYSYLVEDKILFTCDSFGAHFCKDEMFDDLAGDYYDAFKYYFDCILKPFSKFFVKAIEKIENLEIKMIAPGHGPILRSYSKKIIDLSKKLSKEYLATTEHNSKTALILYVSAYGYTKIMAENIAIGIKKANINVEVLDIEKMDLGEIEQKIVLADALLVGCPTINQNALLQVYKLFAIINPIRDKGKLAVAFGSFGWSGEAAEIITANLNLLKLKTEIPLIKMKFKPDTNQIEELVNFGRNFADKI